MLIEMVRRILYFVEVLVLKYLAIDIGGTYVKYALMSEMAEILEKSKVRTPVGYDKTIDDLMCVLEGIITGYLPDIEGIAISMPGILDSETGYSYTGGAIHYLFDQNLSLLLQNRFNIAVTIQNDGKCAAVAELWKGSLMNVKNGAVVLLGTGVGGGIIIDGKLYTGKNFAAGEMSFMLTNPDREEYWGSTNGVNYLLKLASEKTEIPVSELDGVKVFEMANQGNEMILNAIEMYTEKLAIQLFNLQALLDLEVFAIGGGISSQPILLEYLQKHIDNLCSRHPYRDFMPLLLTPKVTTCKFFNDSNLIGAMYHHLNK